MKTIIFILTVLYSASIANAQYTKDNLRLEAAAKSKYHYQNLQLYPIYANAVFVAQHRNVGKYVALKDALEKKKVKITESNGGEVNTLFIENISKDTIMVLSGEVVQGGKQDRMIAQDFILYPKSGKKDISVFCVEHGRWQPADQGMEFKKYYTISSNEVRKAATVKKDQSEVWKKVAETTDANKASTSTGTLTALKESGDFSNELKKYTDFFGNLIAPEQDIIGVIAVSGDGILGCDMFATHELLVEHYPNLINSYSTEAITTGKPVTLSNEKVNQYLQKIIDDESKQESEVQKKGTMLKDGKRKIHISTF
ncbi:MAG TPA: DUF6569 family protein [Cyclobacteriaceae bacterium]|jgi:hypothetical protein|nr:DUF6569 family protein [Cyclobacteriaceae bacterium]